MHLTVSFNGSKIEQAPPIVFYAVADRVKTEITSALGVPDQNITVTMEPVSDIFNGSPPNNKEEVCWIIEQAKNLALGIINE